MDHISFALPIWPGQTEADRAFQRARNGERRTAYAASARAIGITKELWFVQATANGDRFVAYLESPDCARALGQ